MFAVSGGVSRGETLSGAGTERSGEQAGESSYAGSLFQSYHGPFLRRRTALRGRRSFDYHRGMLKRLRACDSASMRSPQADRSGLLDGVLSEGQNFSDTPPG